VSLPVSAQQMYLSGKCWQGAWHDRCPPPAIWGGVREGSVGSAGAPTTPSPIKSKPAHGTDWLCSLVPWLAASRSIYKVRYTKPWALPFPRCILFFLLLRQLLLPPTVRLPPSAAATRGQRVCTVFALRLTEGSQAAAGELFPVELSPLLAML
jgi:hypothetical protein